MDFPSAAVAATLVERPNRYLIRARLESTGDLVNAHCPDPGRLHELLIPGTRVYISRAAETSPRAVPRKTTWDLRFVEHPDGGHLVSLDTRVPNRLFEEGWQASFFPFLRAFGCLRREVPHPPQVRISEASHVLTTRKTPHSRADFLLANAFTPDEPLSVAGHRCWVEVKSCSLVVDRRALFPDAVTERGRRHLLELAALHRSGDQAAVVFIVQRADADEVSAHRATDPAFADALDAAQAAGVTLLAATCSVQPLSITLERLIPVLTSQ